jgi:DNA-binding IclR family transcriptional regulator
MTPRHAAASHGYAAVNALRALEILAHTALTIPQLAARLEQQPVTTRRLIYRLEHDGYVVRAGGGYRAPYALGSRARALGARLAAAPDPAKWLDRGYLPWSEDASEREQS